jgi:hypothetical protein
MTFSFLQKTGSDLQLWRRNGCAQWGPSCGRRWPCAFDAVRYTEGPDVAASNMCPNQKESAMQDANPTERPDTPAMSPETKARNKPSGTHYVEPSPLGIEPVEQTGVDEQTNPPRSGDRPAQTAEVPLGTGAHAEPPGGGGRESQRKR